MGGSGGGGQIRNGVASTLEQIRTNGVKDVPRGTITVFEGVEGEFRWLGTRFELQSAWADVRITNTGSATARYWIHTIFQRLVLRTRFGR